MTKRWSSKALTLTLLTLCLGTCLVACDDDDEELGPGAAGNTGSAHIEVAGTWENTLFGETDVIDDESWSMTFAGDTPFTSTSSIDSFDNTGNYAILKGQDDKYSRIAWTEIDGDSFYSCTVAFGLASAEDAEATEGTADTSDPDNGGCGESGFPWTKLTRQ